MALCRPSEDDDFDLIVEFRIVNGHRVDVRIPEPRVTVFAVAWAFATSKMGLRILACIGVALVLGAIYHHVWHNGYVDGAADVQEKWDADKAERLRAYTEMTTRWVVASQDAEKAIKERDNARAQRFEPARQHAASLPPSVASVRVPAAAVGVLDDAVRESAATGSAAKPAEAAAEPAGSAESTVGLMTQWGVEMVDLYDACRKRNDEWASFYASLRRAQPKPEATP